MTVITKLSSLSIKNVESETGIISGYASTFNNIDAYGETVRPGAFTESLNQHSTDAIPVPLLFEHSRSLDSHVGVILTATEDATGLLITAQLDMETESGRKAFSLAKGRRITGMSIGFMAIETALEQLEGQDVLAIKRADLREISLVLNPADEYARVTSVKSAQPQVGTQRKEILEKAQAFSPYPGSPQRGSLAYRFNEAYEKVHQLITNNASIVELKSSLSSLQDLNDRIKRVTAKNESTTKLKNLDIGDIETTGSAPGANSNERETQKMNSRLPGGNVRLAVKAADRTQVSKNLANGLETKSLVATDLLVPVAANVPIQATERAALTLLEHTPTTVTVSPSFSYLRQNVRELKAGVVPTGEAKPESKLGFERVDTSLDVVAHIVTGIDEYILQDIEALTQFINNEMISGVMEKVENLIVEAINAEEGQQTQSFTEDAFTSARLAQTKLQSQGLTPAYYIMHHDDWALMETSKSSGSGMFMFNSAPVNTTDGTLWGTPVLPTIHATKGNSKLIAQDSIGLWTDGAVALATNRSQEDFEHNHVSFRAEGRFKPGVKRAAGIVDIDIAATEPIEP